MSSERSKRPTSAHAAYRIGAAWPLDRMKRSFPGCWTFFGSNRISARNSDATRSAAEQQLVGWPLPASDVERTESIRRRVAAFFRAGMKTVRSIGGKRGEKIL